MVMAAGVGSRLEPLTQKIPKPLVPVSNKPVMDILLQKLKNYGVEHVIANTHYLAEKIQTRYKDKNSPVNIDIKFLHETELSGTAGGVKKCQFFFEDTDNFLVLSADGLHDADLEKIIQSHIKSGCIATMAISADEHNEVSKYGVVVPSKDFTVEEFQEKPPIYEAKSNFINTGIYVFNKRIFDFIPENRVYDFAKDVFPSLMEAGEKINVYRIYSYWSDIGTISQYIQSNIDALSKKVMIPNSDVVRKYDTVYTAGRGVQVAETAVFKNNVIIGNNCKIGENTVLDNVILWDNVVVEDGVELKNIVCANNSVIKSSVDGSDEWKVFGPEKIIEFEFAD